MTDKLRDETRLLAEKYLTIDFGEVGEGSLVYRQKLISKCLLDLLRENGELRDMIEACKATIEIHRNAIKELSHIPLSDNP